MELKVLGKLWHLAREKDLYLGEIVISKLNVFARTGTTGTTPSSRIAATSGWCSDAGHDSIEETAYSEAFTSATNFISRPPYGVQWLRTPLLFLPPLFLSRVVLP